MESLQVDVDTAFTVEGRYFVDLVVGQISTNMIQALWFDLNRINGGGSRPAVAEPSRAAKVGVLGAGMMGAGIAYAFAKVGVDVVLKDVSTEGAEKGKAHVAALVGKQVARGRMTQEKADAFLARITPTGDAADLAGCDVIVEAVFEDQALKHRVLGEAEAHAAARTRCWRPTRPRCRSPGSPRACSGRPTSSACTSSRRWTRCRWSS